ncbi:cAMP-binding domain of CRP or a regulatory subunit of cAMP-dependent protein kinases [Duganella sp. CF402]|uniref:Crp/Fnr family transcriptional regulator n=1 Tax=unclassified Duganella TaxID=2636909 RepID=UPI0008CA9400|nr:MULTISPECIES: Crp/Fnr family transcriptional regulator [unclassified Duganella]RZT08687.1 CRP-like cAMP-binding protein [Duganella sp. BK701]SEL85398.1 cAMP-binding domain of CRP or a regulatory subunit of cAMP-dependent protein kinases [Duganella sp. CF402]
MASKRKSNEAPLPDLVPPDEAARLMAAAREAGGANPQMMIHLRKIPLLADLSEEDMARVKADLRIRQYLKRDVVLQKGGPGDSLLFLLTGSLQVVDITEEGRAIGLRMLAPGDFFGEIAVINGSARSASVVALSPVLVALLPRQTALHLFAHAPSVANHMLRFLAAKVQRDSEFRALLSIHNTPRRIYTFLTLLMEKKDDGVHVVSNLPTHQDMANMINTSRETVTRTLLALIQQGIIEKGPHSLLIVRPDELQKLAQV